VTRDDVLAYPHQIGDALWRIEAAGIPRAAGSDGVAVCGPAHGAGELAAAILGERGVGPEPLVLCVSYGGDDEEALSCFVEAGERGAPRAVVCTAGRLAQLAREEGVPVIGVPAGIDDSRAAIMYFVVAAIITADPSLRAEVEGAVPTLARIAEMPLEEAKAVELEGMPPIERILSTILIRDLTEARA
jgi:hypothetical protein